MAACRRAIADPLRNLWAGLRLLVALPVSAGDFLPGAASIIAGFLAIALVIAAFDYVNASGAALDAAADAVYFNPAGAAVLGSIFFLVALVAILLCAAREQWPRLPLLLTALLTAAPVYLIALYGLMAYAWHTVVHPGAWLALACWGLAAVMRAVGITFGRPRLREFALVVVSAGGFTLTALSQYLTPDLFYAYDAAVADDYAAIDQEATFYRQRDLVAAKVGGLAPQTPGQADLYFVGFAGNGDQTLFRREVRFAQDLMDRQFGTASRSLSLVNDLDRLATEPLANRHNLRDTLRALGQVMDVEHDVLFLFLTSHGDRDANLQVSLYPFELQGLTGEELREYLDASGIQWRVVVISACYSGSFIAALANEQTLLMTAAAEDATSFGCSDERELTYFGEALFKDALSAERNLAAAFTAAQQSITERERQEGIDPSSPQLQMGERIAVKLRAMGLLGEP